MKEIYSNERRKAVGDLNRGKRLSSETRELISKAAKNRQPMSIKSRLLCATNTRPIMVTNLDGSNARVFPSIVAAANVLQCNEKTIRRALTSNFRVKGTYIVIDITDT